MKINNIVYIAELDQDVDDVIAARYLHQENALTCVVLDPYPTTPEGIERLKSLQYLGIPIARRIPPTAKHVFVGGPLTLVAEHIKFRHIETLVMNGGFVGHSLSTHELPKFKNKETIRTFNFNNDVNATDSVLRSDANHIEQIILIGKNVCHDKRNTRSGFWSDDKYQKIFDEYNVSDHKLQHDMLACHEGLALLNNEPTFCQYDIVRPYNTGLNGNKTLWGSTKSCTSPYRNVLAAIGYRKDLTT